MPLQQLLKQSSLRQNPLKKTYQEAAGRSAYKIEILSRVTLYNFPDAGK